METLQTDKICRACLLEDDKMIDMSEKDVYKKFLLFANLPEIPGIPFNLCQSCEQKLNISSIGFKEECQKSHEILLNYIKNTHEVKLEATDADTHQVDSEATADANKLSRLQKIPQNQVWEAIRDLKLSVCKNKNINCVRCSFVGSNLYRMSQHISQVHEDLKQLWCRVCNAEFDNLTNHVATIHSNDYPCKFCSKKFPTVNRLRDHLHNHSDVKPFCCSFCKKHFLRQGHLNFHLIKHMKTKPFKAPHKCSYCDKKFKAPSHVAAHERIHTGDKPYICQVCGKKFNHSSILNAHMMVHNIGANKISCDICNKKFQSRNKLNTHLRTHTGEKPFVCTECGKAFISSYYLATHNITHSNLRPYQCNNCDKSFKQKPHLKSHMLIHSGEKPYKCNQCLCAYRRGDSLTNHMKQHEVDKPREDRPHVCLMCSRTFTTDALLTSHIHTHTVSFLEI